MGEQGFKSGLAGAHDMLSNDRGVDRASYRLAAVVGPYRSGTSCVAGILHSLGVSMGRSLMDSNEANPKGYFEPRDLQKRITSAIDERRMELTNSSDQFIEWLKQWFDENRKSENIIGIKLPVLCLLMEEAEQAWGSDVRWIAVDRPIEQAARSLKQANWEWLPGNVGLQECEDILRQHRCARDEFLRGKEHLRIDYPGLVKDPDHNVRTIAAFLELSVETSVLEQAAGFVESSLWRQR